MPEMRLQKYLSACGVMSRRAAEENIQKGFVKVNGRVAEIGQKIDPERDKVFFDGKPVEMAGEKIYILLNKPRGYVTTMSDEKGRPCVADIFSDLGTRVYPVGRLDMDSEGLLIMTNDGELSNHLMHPRHHVDKAYHLHIRGFADDGKLERLSGSFNLDGYVTVPAEISVIERTETRAVLKMVIHEGRNRQIRRMCELCGLEIRRLRRVRMGEIDIGLLNIGEWRYLTKKEVENLMRQ